MDSNQTFVVYINFHVCIMYVLCINIYRYINEAMVQYIKIKWIFIYHVLKNLAIMFHGLTIILALKLKKLQVDELFYI